MRNLCKDQLIDKLVDLFRQASFDEIDEAMAVAKERLEQESQEKRKRFVGPPGLRWGYANFDNFLTDER
ncbi:hypothetical protein MYX07_01885 [Patescibacteria group bacterium AH-259-L07]|nr:hypothetical protein [Patescibacteria group bacterium AH-259-L07]